MLTQEQEKQLLEFSCKQMLADLTFPEVLVLVQQAILQAASEGLSKLTPEQKEEFYNKNFVTDSSPKIYMP